MFGKSNPVADPDISFGGAQGWWLGAWPRAPWIRYWSNLNLTTLYWCDGVCSVQFVYRRPRVHFATSGSIRSLFEFAWFGESSVLLPSLVERYVLQKLYAVSGCLGGYISSFVVTNLSHFLFCLSRPIILSWRFHLICFLQSSLFLNYLWWICLHV